MELPHTYPIDKPCASCRIRALLEGRVDSRKGISPVHWAYCTACGHSGPLSGHGRLDRCVYILNEMYEQSLSVRLSREAMDTLSQYLWIPSPRLDPAAAAIMAGIGKVSSVRMFLKELRERVGSISQEGAQVTRKGMDTPALVFSLCLVPGYTVGFQLVGLQWPLTVLLGACKRRKDPDDVFIPVRLRCSNRLRVYTSLSEAVRQTYQADTGPDESMNIMALPFPDISLLSVQRHLLSI